MRRFSGITTTQLARICGVSQGTVDRALHDRAGIRRETKEKILAVAREYEYLPRIDLDGSGGRSMLIGVVLFDLYNAFFSKLAMSFVSEARACGYSVIFLFSNQDLHEEKAAVDYFHSIGVDGIVLFSVGSDEEAYQNYLHSLRRPIVTIGNPLFDLTYIGVDNELAMYDLTIAMLQQTGTGELQYFAPALKKDLHSRNAQRMRVAGFRRAMEESGRDYRIVWDVAELSESVVGTVCSTDHYVFQALKRLGTSTQQRFAGFDGISSVDCLSVQLLTVQYSTNRIARECIHYFLRRTYHACIEHTIVCKEM